MAKLPMVVRLVRPDACRTSRFNKLLYAVARRSRTCGATAVGAFGFRNDEGKFARLLLERHARLWLFRSNQRAFCGDFLVVDMSTPIVERRRCWALDLKQGQRIERRAGIQFKNIKRALAETQVLSDSVVPEYLMGDGYQLAEFSWQPIPRQ